MLWRSGTRKKPVYAEFPAMEAYYEVEVIIPDDLFEVGKIKVFPLDSRNRESFFVSIGMALIHSFAATIRWDVYPIYPISFSEQPFSLLYKTKRNFPVSILDTGKLE